jgi:hypothetical protein
MNITPAAAVVYYSQKLLRLGQELHGLGYSLGSITDARLPEAMELHNLAGTAARLHSQIGQALETVEKLMYAAEAAAPKG